MPGPNYRVQVEERRCGNCKRCFIMQEYDEFNAYFCRVGAEPRPKCGSVMMDEVSEDIDNGYEAWERWAAANLVAEEGICDNFE